MSVPHLSLNQRRLTAAVAAVLGLTLAPVEGGTFTWLPDTTGTWSSSANWTGGVAPTGNDPADILIFGGSTGSSVGVAPNYTATDDITGAFLLNRLQFEAADGSGSQSTSNVLAGAAGSSLRFSGPNAQILQNGTGNFTIKIPISSTSNLEFGGTAANSVVTLDGPLSGTFDITKTGSNTFRFGSMAGTEPASDTWFGTLTINGGTVRFNNNAYTAPSALRSNPVVLTAGSVLSTQLNSTDPTTSLRLGTLSGSGGSVSAKKGLSDSIDIVITALKDGSYGGTISNTGGGTTDGVLIVRGAGAQTFTGAMQIAKDIVVGRGASLVLAGSASLSSQTTNASIILNGGTFRLDNTQVNNANRLRDGSISSTGLDTVGGGTFSLVGNVAGTTEQISRLQLGAGNPRSGALTINVTQPANATAPTVLNIQNYSRQVGKESFATVDFTSNSTLGSTGINPRIVFNGSSPILANGLLSGSDGIDVGWATVNGSSFATQTSTSTGVAPVATRDFGSGSTSITDNVLLAGNGTISAAYTRSSLKIAPTANGQQLGITGSGSLATTALLLAGTTDFSINNGGTGTGGWSASSPRYAFVQAATLSLDVPLLGNGALVKSGAGTLALTNSSHATFAQPVAINDGALRATPGSTLPQGEIRLRGGVLELQGNGTTTTTFARQIGRGANRITWSGVDTLGAKIGDDRGSGGFAAIGSDATVSITSMTGSSDLAWEDAGFLSSGYALIFGSRSADRVVNWTSNLNLSDATELGSIPNYNAREIRVIDNVDSSVTSDRARISGNITGTVRNDLLKTGTGVLELGGTNTFAGATIVQEGTLLVNGSSTSFITDVRNGGTLGGKGTVGAVRVEAGGTLAPGELAGFSGRTSTLTLNGDLSFADTISKLRFELEAGSYDKLSVKGSVTLAGAELEGSLLNGFASSPGDLFFLIINDGTDAVQGTFAQGSSLQFGGQTFEISYTGDFDSQQFTGGNDVVLRAVPEPSAAMLLGSALAIFAARRRKRH